MRGNTNYQIQELFKAVNNIGSSKHTAKAEARASGATGWHETGKQLGIHSFKTADAYRAVWRQVLEFTKSAYGVKDIEKLTGEHVSGFLQSKIDQGVAHATFLNYAAVAEKLEMALNRYSSNHNTGNSYDFSNHLKEVRHEAKDLERFQGSRAYEAPGKLISTLEGKHRLTAKLQHQGGARISEVNHISETQLKGIKPDEITGMTKGFIEVEGKGGKVREIGVSVETYNQLSAVIQTHGRFEFNKNDYRENLKAAAAITDQDYTGTHGLRWSYAQSRFNEVQEHGHTYDEALVLVSQELGHERADITLHYLVPNF